MPISRVRCETVYEIPARQLHHHRRVVVPMFEREHELGGKEWTIADLP